MNPQNKLFKIVFNFDSFDDINRTFYKSYSNNTKEITILKETREAETKKL